MLARFAKWVFHSLVKVKTGFVYKTRKGVRWYIVVRGDTVLVFWNEHLTGPRYEIPISKWYRFIKDVGVTFEGYKAP